MKSSANSKGGDAATIRAAAHARYCDPSIDRSSGTRKTDKIRRSKVLRGSGHLPKQEITDPSPREAQDLRADVVAHELPGLPISLESTPPETSQMLGPSLRSRETSVVRLARDRGGGFKGGKGDQLCFDFRDNGSCHYGDECRFSHGDGNTRRRGGEGKGKSKSKEICDDFTPSRPPGRPLKYPFYRSSEERQTSRVEDACDETLIISHAAPNVFYQGSSIPLYEAHHLQGLPVTILRTHADYMYQSIGPYLLDEPAPTNDHLLLDWIEATQDAHLRPLLEGAPSHLVPYVYWRGIPLALYEYYHLQSLSLSERRAHANHLNDTVGGLGGTVPEQDNLLLDWLREMHGRYLDQHLEELRNACMRKLLAGDTVIYDHSRLCGSHQSPRP